MSMLPKCSGRARPSLLTLAFLRAAAGSAPPCSGAFGPATRSAVAPVLRRPAAFFSALLFLAVLFGAAPSSAQSRITLFGGPFIPVAEFGDTFDGSWMVGSRVEFQGVNGRGQAGSTSFFLEAAYHDVPLKPLFYLDAAAPGEVEDSTLLIGALGLRVYARPAPLFISVGAGYVRFVGADDEADLDGLDLQLGAGFRLPWKVIQSEVAATVHENLFDTPSGFGEFDRQFLTLTLGVSIPF